MRKIVDGVCLVSLAAACLAAQTAAAQEQAAPEAENSARDTDEGAIIVTARKREEALSDVPVAVTAFSAAQIEKLGLKGIDDLGSFTPGLIVSESAVSSGGSIFLRGIGSGSSNVLADQSVAINVDGMQVGTFNVRKLGQIDLAQIEVLRGPQALFFGKNSPGGVVSFTTADPGRDREVIFSANHEFVSNDSWVQAIVSTPLSDNAGLRLVGRYTDLGGYFHVRSVPGTGDPLVIPSSVKRWPSGREYFLRGTLVVEPDDKLFVRAKATYSHSFIRGGSATAYQRVACPYGAPQGQPDFPCVADRDVYLGSAPAAAIALEPDAPTTDGLGQRKNDQFLGTLELRYDIADGLRATSLTGYYSYNEVNDHNPSGGPRATVITPYLPFDMDQFTQEFRLSSDWDGPVNFTGGLFFEARKTSTQQNGIALIFGPPIAFGEEAASQKQRAYSAYGQLIFNPVEPLEISAGLRWSKEKKSLRFFRNDVDLTGNLLNDHLTYDNVSPELTASYHLNPDIMAFVSYKKGFKSGGFDAGFTNGGILRTPFRNDFAEEHVEGFEGGIKGNVGRLFLDLVAYTYNYDDLQVSNYDPNTISFKVLNAAAARARGIELNARWRTPLQGFVLNGSVTYNDSRFKDFRAGCYVGQTPTLGCDLTLDPVSGDYKEQDLTGRRLNNAPEWAATAGASYGTELASGAELDLSVDLVYSGRYTTNLFQGPYDFQNAFAKLNASAKFTSADKSWDIMLIGRNLTNKYTVATTSALTFTGSGSGNPNARFADTYGVVSRGREIFLQVTLRPGFLN